MWLNFFFDKGRSGCINEVILLIGESIYLEKYENRVVIINVCWYKLVLFLSFIKVLYFILMFLFKIWRMFFRY